MRGAAVLHPPSPLGYRVPRGPAAAPPIVLLTDFGEADPFVGTMKGVFLTRFPQARVVDLTHQVPPQDVRLGAFYLMNSAPYFPEGSIFACVVDPGVGSRRRILWARTARHQFLAPDNGLLSWVERRTHFLEMREVTNRKLFLRTVSSTFHGRDIFAPVAAELAAGLNPQRLGPKSTSMVRLAFPEPRRTRGAVHGVILTFDRFGNAVTNIATAGLRPNTLFWFREKEIGALRPHYGAAGPARSVAVTGSSGFVELAVEGGSFASRFDARAGDLVEGRHG